MAVSCAFCGERVEVPERCWPWHYVRRDVSPHDSASMLMIGDDWPRGGVRLLHRCSVANGVDAVGPAGARSGRSALAATRPARHDRDSLMGGA